jgi:hypothetical protein
MKVSSLKKDRIRTSFVDRNTSVNKTDAVKSVSSIPPIKNSAYYSSENHLIFYDQFYENLKELRKEYKRFYHDEQLLENAIENFDKDKLLDSMKALISNYNNAIKSLTSFDETFGTNQVRKIQGILVDYENKLENLGIYIIEGKELKLNEKNFIRNIENNEHVLEFLFEPTKGIILKLFSAFKNIRIPKRKALEKLYENSNYTGMLLDNKT